MHYKWHHEPHTLNVAVNLLPAESATWRRGAQGGKHSGEPLSNKCGVWEFRHPDSPPRDEVSFASPHTVSPLSYHTLRHLAYTIAFC